MNVTLRHAMYMVVHRKEANCKLQLIRNLVSLTEERRQRATIIGSIPQRTEPGHTLTEASMCISSFQFK